jgi:20S proteasome alpha/beta subunit
MNRYFTAVIVHLYIIFNLADCNHKMTHSPLGTSQAAIALHRRRIRRSKSVHRIDKDDAGVIYDRYGRIPRLERAFEVVSKCSPMTVCGLPGEGLVVTWSEKNGQHEEIKSPLLVGIDAMNRIIDFTQYGFRLGWVGLPGDCVRAVQRLQRRLSSCPLPQPGPELAAEVLASMLYDAAVGKDDLRPLACHFFVMSCTQARVWEVDSSGYVQEVRAAAAGKHNADLRRGLEDFMGNRSLSRPSERVGDRAAGRRAATSEHMVRLLGETMRAGRETEGSSAIRSEYFEVN